MNEEYELGLRSSEITKGAKANVELAFRIRDVFQDKLICWFLFTGVFYLTQYSNTVHV